MKRSPQTIAENKKALFNYEILERKEAGLVLKGHEAKAARIGNINLKGGYVSISNGEAFLENVHIGKYPYASQTIDDPKRRRKLLLHKKEIQKLSLQSSQKGITIIPLEARMKNGRIKITLGIARSRKKYDKREILKKKSQEMEIKHAIKRFTR